ncbi:hypothetical protein HZS_7651, partial [Henneguya salminicola]
MEIFIEDKSKNEPSDNTIRENFFIMKLATKDQELREALAQIQALKAHISSPIAEKLYISNQQPQVLPTVNDVTSVINSDKNILEDLNNIPTTYLTDPALNYLYSKVLEEIEKYKSRLNDAEDELKGANFNLDSVTGRKLISKCRLLENENEELGKEFTEGRFSQLDLALKMERRNRLNLEESFKNMIKLVDMYETQIETLQSVIVRQKQDINILVTHNDQ